MPHAEVRAHLERIARLREAGDTRAALHATREALASLPAQAVLHYAAALCLDELGASGDAVAHYELALVIDPQLEDALHNRGILLARMGRTEDALENHRTYIARFPFSLRAREVLVDLLLASGRMQDALQALDEHPERLSHDVRLAVRRGVALASLRRFAEAEAAFAGANSADSQAVEKYLQQIAPGARPDVMLSPQNIYLWQCHLATQRCDWSHSEAVAGEMRRLPRDPTGILEPAVAFVALHLPLSGEERHAVAQRVAALIEQRTAVLPRLELRPHARIRIGLLSPDLREHLNAYLLLPLFELLDRSHFQIFAYSLAADDGSEVRRRLKSAADQFRDLYAMDDEEAAGRVRGDKVDILIDVGGHSANSRFGITARRPAPLQVNYLGFPGSLGSTRVDYAIVDRVVAGSAAEWSETLVHLPHCYFLYDFRAAPPPIAASRHDYGLPADAFVFCAFHRADKITPDAFALWMRILLQVPRAVLWLLALPAAAQTNLRRVAAAHGVDPARLVFAPFDPRERYLARQSLGDLMLDAVHHSAMTTGCDALAAGLPLLTLRGQAMASRAGESLLRAAGLPELVAGDADTFADMAVRLAGDPGRLARYRERLRGRSAPLFDTAARVRELETAFTEIWERALKAG